MKYAIVIPDGCSDEPQAALDGRTPLQAARTPWMDRIAKQGCVGAANHVPEKYSPGSAVANMSLLGFDPLKYFTGRAPIEGIAQGIHLGENDWAIRCNLVTLKNEMMASFTAGQFPSESATLLLKDLQRALDREIEAKSKGAFTLEAVPGVSYRNMLICRSQQRQQIPFASSTETTAPHDLSEKSITPGLPRGPGSEELQRWMKISEEVFANHPVNQKRIELGLSPATHVWLWGLGQKPALPDFQCTYQKTGAMITAVDLLRGLAKLVGWEVVEVAGATGYLDTDYSAKAEYAIRALSNHDIVCIHVEATDEASHEGNQEEKIRALENIDEKIVGPLFRHMESLPERRILVTPDHPTFLRTRTHSRGSVPFAVVGTGIQADRAETYSELTCAASPIQYDPGHRLMEDFLNVHSRFSI